MVAIYKTVERTIILSEEEGGVRGRLSGNDSSPIRFYVRKNA